MKTMLKLLFLSLVACVSETAIAAAATSPAEKLKVVTTIPDLADITNQIGGDRVDVMSICKGRENAHAVSVKPSHLVAMSKCDMFVEVGLSLELAFVPGLLESCRNEKIQPGKAAFVNCSVGWEAIEVPASLSRQAGDVHPHGNPHMNLDPRAGRHIAGRVFEALVAIDSESKVAYQKRYDDYLAKLTEAEKRWSEIGTKWKGEKIIEYHQEYRYFAHSRGIDVIGTVETKPGVPPTPNHIAHVIDLIKRERVKVIVTAIWSNNATVRRIAEESGAIVLEIPNMCGGLPGTETWIGMMDVLHKRFAGAFGTTVPSK